jgi:hypothetical protein
VEIRIWQKPDGRLMATGKNSLTMNHGQGRGWYRSILDRIFIEKE